MSNKKGQNGTENVESGNLMAQFTNAMFSNSPPNKPLSDNDSNSSHGRHIQNWRIKNLRKKSQNAETRLVQAEVHHETSVTNPVTNVSDTNPFRCTETAFSSRMQENLDEIRIA